MDRRLDIPALLRRGGEMTSAEVEQLRNELTEAKLAEMGGGISERSLDQPVKVVPLSDTPPAVVEKCFTQQKFIWGKTPEEMEAILGIFGKLKSGAFVLEINCALRSGEFENRAYSYLPNGKKYEPDPEEKSYLPGDGAPQWFLRVPVQAKCIARLRPGQRFNRSSLIR